MDRQGGRGGEGARGRREARRAVARRARVPPLPAASRPGGPARLLLLRAVRRRGRVQGARRVRALPALRLRRGDPAAREPRAKVLRDARRLMKPAVVLVGTLDTKGHELDYLRARVKEHGLDVLLVDAGIYEPQVGPDISRHDVARAAGADVEQLAAAGDRGAAMET